MFTVLSSWHSHCQSSLGSSDERSTVLRGYRANQVEPMNLPKLAALALRSPSPMIETNTLPIHHTLIIRYLLTYLLTTIKATVL